MFISAQASSTFSPIIQAKQIFTAEGICPEFSYVHIQHFLKRVEVTNWA